MRDKLFAVRFAAMTAGACLLVVVAGNLVRADSDSAAHAIAEKFAKEAAKSDAQARRRAENEKRKAEKVEETEMLARARAEAERRRIDMMRAREEAERADGQRKADEAIAQAEAARKAAEEAKAAEALRQAEIARKAEEERRLAEIRKAEEEAQAAEAVRQAEIAQRAEGERRLVEAEARRKAEEEARAAEALRQAEVARKAEEERRLTEIRKAEEEARAAEALRQAQRQIEEAREAESRRVAEEARLAEIARAQEMAHAEEARRAAQEDQRRAALEAEREAEARQLSERLRSVREDREMHAAETGHNTHQWPSADMSERVYPASRHDGRVTVLLLMQPGDRGIRRNNKSADPVLCSYRDCYVSSGPGRAASLLPARRALGFFRTWGRRAGACNNSLGCVFRGVDLDRLNGMLMPVDMRVVRHDRREAQTVEGSSDCQLEQDRLTCRNGIHAEDYIMWLVPESLADRAGPAVLMHALEDELPLSERTASAPLLPGR